MKFLLHKDKEEKENASPQKQECGCSSLQLQNQLRDRQSLRNHTQLVSNTYSILFLPIRLRCLKGI